MPNSYFCPLPLGCVSSQNFIPYLKVKDKGVPVHSLQACRGVELQLCSFLNLTLDGGRGHCHATDILLPVPTGYMYGWAREPTWTLLPQRGIEPQIPICPA